LAEGDFLRAVAHHGPIPTTLSGVPVSHGSLGGRAFLSGMTVQVADMLAETDPEFAESRERAARIGFRGELVTPLQLGGEPLGIIVIRRREVRPFTEQQVAQLETFARLTAT